MKRFSASAAILLLAVSCNQSESVSRQTISFVREVISNPDSYDFHVISGKAPDRNNTIFLIGEESECDCFTKEFLQCDRHDNVNGSLTSDLLPDFAGETVVSMKDFANTPYSGYLEWRNEDFLRELTVKSVISAMDTVCCISPYDLNYSSTQPLPKLIILTSSYNAEYGLYDVDSLFSATNCRIPVINPLDLMMEKAVKSAASNVGVIATDTLIASGIYSAVFQRKAHERKLENPECVAFSVREQGAPLREFLDKYLQAGYTKPLDAILIDDSRFDMESLRNELSQLTSVLNVESLTYSRIADSNTLLLESRRVTSENAFRLFRKMNLFSHAIRFPEAEQFMIVPAIGLDESYYKENGYFTDEFKYSRPAASGDKSVILIEYSEKFLPYSPEQCTE